MTMTISTPIVLVPGQLCTELLWAPQSAILPSSVQILVQSGFDTVGDMAGSVLDQAPARFALVCHAMGGFVAFEIMRRAPQRVSRLVLISTLAPADTPRQTVRREGYLRLVEQGRFSDIIEERIPMLVHPSQTGNAVLTGTLRRMAEDTGPDAFLRQQRAIMSRPDSRPTLPQISCPTLLIFGRQDAITTMDHQQEMVSAIANARLNVVENCGHMVTLERPETVNTYLGDFLR
jgi:pimeloyl-ACP methyl ester carboxylesterase